MATGLESRMVHLSEKFAGVALVSVPDIKAGVLKSALTSLEEEGRLRTAWS